MAAPVHGELVAAGAGKRARLRPVFLEAAAVVLEHRGGLALGQQSVLLEALAVDLARRRMLADRLVHERLGRRRLVRLVVAVPAVAHEVDHDVLAELHAVVEREARHEHDRLRIVRVHVEDRRLDHLRDVAAIERRTGVLGSAGREPDLVVDDDVQRAAGRESARLRELQRFHHDALAGERRVAVDQQRQDGRARGVAALLLARTHRALDDRVDHLEVRRIECEHDVDVAAGRAQVRRESLVVLDVAGAPGGSLLELALELGEQHRRRLAEHVDQHVEASAVRHADHDFLDARGAASLHDVVEERDQRVAALEREALLAHVARVQVALESLGRGELPEQVQALVVGEAVVEPPVLEAVLEPEPLLARRDVRELGADAAGVDLPELLQDLRQLHLLVDAARAARGVEHRVHVGVGEAHIGGIEHARHRALHEAERVDVGDEVAPVRVELDQPRDRGLLLGVRSGRRVRRARLPDGRAGDAAAASRRLLARAGPNGLKNSRHSGLTLDGSARKRSYCSST